MHDHSIDLSKRIRASADNPDGVAHLIFQGIPNLRRSLAALVQVLAARHSEQPTTSSRLLMGARERGLFASNSRDGGQRPPVRRRRPINRQVCVSLSTVPSQSDTYPSLLGRQAGVIPCCHRRL